MAYISSNANRWYVARESAYGQIPAISAFNRIPAVKLTAQQQREKSQRKDKTGSRTWQGMPAGDAQANDLRPDVLYEGLAGSVDFAVARSAGRSGNGRRGRSLAGGNAGDSATTASSIAFAGSHGLNSGPGDYVGRRDPVRCGRIGPTDRDSECAVFVGARARGDARPDGNLQSRDATAQRHHFRLLGSVNGGAADSVRRGGGSDDA